MEAPGSNGLPLVFPPNRVGGEVTLAVPPYHRTYGSVSRRFECHVDVQAWALTVASRETKPNRWSATEISGTTVENGNPSRRDARREAKGTVRAGRRKRFVACGSLAPLRGAGDRQTPAIRWSSLRSTYRLRSAIPFGIVGGRVRPPGVIPLTARSAPRPASRSRRLAVRSAHFVPVLVFREGTEDRARGGPDPHSLSEFGQIPLPAQAG